MESQNYSVIDVETTGKGVSGNRITEICIVKMQGSIVLDKYTSLVNPDENIPSYITRLTGIDNAMVEDAPKFHEIAKDILELTENSIFVAHNVNFDYNVIRNEFKLLNIDFNRKKLCTVRLARKLIPGLFSYSLGKLCSSINIVLNNRHRAEGDTDATVILFQRLLDLDTDFKVINSFLHARSKQATLPPHLCIDQINDLPQKPGVYLFKNNQHKVIYAGKAKNIKKRVLSHFYDKKNSEYLLGQETYHIDYEITGNELAALLLESDLIRQHYPKFNRAQKRPVKTYQIISYINQRGVIQLALGVTKAIDDSIFTFYNRTLAIEKLEELCEKFNLCPRYCSLQQNVKNCSHYKIKNCEGICDGSEPVEDYNIKVKLAIESLTNEKPSYVIRENGRTNNENCVVVVKEGVFQGFGFLSSDEYAATMEDFEPFITNKKATYHTHSILQSYLAKTGEKNLIHFTQTAIP